MTEQLARTGINGLDDVLSGGLPRSRIYLIEGDPGAGKTTLALQFLLEGLSKGECGLYVTLSETKDELYSVARSHGWNLDKIAVHELGVAEDQLTPAGTYTFFHPSEVELGTTTKAVLDEVERVKPQRVVFDSLSEMRLLARDPLRYRRQILGLKQFFIGRSCTVLLLDDRTSGEGELQLQSLAHGVITLDQLAPLYGAARRRLRIVKMRGVQYRGGYHDFTIERGGLAVYPRLVAAEHPSDAQNKSSTKVPAGDLIRPMTSTGIKSLDALLGGGLTRGTSTLVMGPAGSGKSAFSTQHACAAALRGEKVAIFAFDETLPTLFERARATGSQLPELTAKGMIKIQQIDPAELSPGEFIQNVRDAVDRDDVKVVVIDSLNGYINAMPEERFLTIQLHELLSYLGQKGVVTILIVAQHGLLGSSMESPVDISYLADTVLVLRYFEAAGKLHKAISVMKKRHGYHESTIREYTLSEKGLHVGEPLAGYHGIMTGVPQPSIGTLTAKRDI